VSIIAGKARVIAARGVIPSCPINQNSARTTKALIKNAIVLGADNFSSKGRIGSLKICLVFLSIG